MGKYGTGIHVSDGNGNGNEVIEMGGIWYEKSILAVAHLYSDGKCCS